jgi:5'-deoxynucleotidase YfbR-like HD superfamily hydrolase
MKNWIMTYSGKPIQPLDPAPGDILIEDVAHALAMTCRWAGHCHTYYSVAEHSVRVSEVCGNLARALRYPSYQVTELEMLGLMHDATEAYLGDIPRPLKSQFKLETPRGLETFRVAEDHLYRVIEVGLGLPVLTDEYEKIVKQADNILLSTEARDVAHNQSLDHEEDRQEPLAAEIDPLHWKAARKIFMLRYADLRNKVLQ